MRKSGNKAAGQALVMFMGFTAAVIGIFLIAFNSGQLTNAKIRAMNAADAAAYSAAVDMARALNALPPGTKPGPGIFDNAKQMAEKVAVANLAQLAPGSQVLFARDQTTWDAFDGDTSKKLPFAVEVMINKDDIPTSKSSLKAETVQVDGTKIEHDPHYPGGDGGAYALAEACVKYEAASVAPFASSWRASLATEDAGSRQKVDAAKGLTSITSTLGVGSCR